MVSGPFQLGEQDGDVEKKVAWAQQTETNGVSKCDWEGAYG